MNKRIKELAYAAKLDEHMLWTSDEGMVLPYEMRKFAELIVRECARVGGDIVLNQNEDNDMGVFLGIKHHFGVD